MIIFALYVLVGLTRPLDVLHSDLSCEARADLVENSFWRKHNKINSDQKQKHENTKRKPKTKTTNDINENTIRNKRKHEKQNHDNNNMVPAAKKQNTCSSKVLTVTKQVTSTPLLVGTGASFIAAA